MKTSSSRNNAASSVMEVVVGAKGVSGLVVIKVGLVATLGIYALLIFSKDAPCVILLCYIHIYMYIACI